jgi:glycosyltransferase involved in cell wall biosynthesis
MTCQGTSQWTSQHPDSHQDARPTKIKAPPEAGLRHPAASDTHLVVIPSFNSGMLLARTVSEARARWAPIWVVIDGSTDNSADAVEAMAQTDPAVRVLHLSRNRGKGAAVRHGVTAAAAGGFTHALVMDADGQHPAESIQSFMAASADCPAALIMGRPMFGTDAPWLRIVSRRLSNAGATLLTGRDAGDALFGFRVYPIAALLGAMQASPAMHGFDFDPEAVIRLAWAGTRLVHLPAPVRYFARAQGGVSHFNYAADNLLLGGMFLRLGGTALMRLARGERRGRGRGQGRSAVGPHCGKPSD